jgi:ssRNA-specific RNase YbeY (16S rRNA maturation enzyme)
MQLPIPCFHDELMRVIIHGILHLCGYDDHEETDIAFIRKKEAYYLKKLVS